MTIEKNNKFKSVSPIDTIKQINDILYEKLNTVPKITWNCNSEFDLYSCRIESTNFPFLGANGKGTTPFYALASGQSEFLERVQPIVPYTARHPQKDVIYPDSKLENDEIQELFYDIYNQEYVYKTYSQYCHETTGLAAGNTYEEAIVQGLCELIERDHVWKFFNHELKINNIIPYRNKHLDKIEQILQQKITFYDVSRLNFPVVLMVYMDYDNSHCCLNFGVAPDLNLACERCLTEIFQGFSIDEQGYDFIRKMPIVDIKPNAFLQYVDFSGNGIGFMPAETIFTFLDSLNIAAFNHIKKYPKFNNNVEALHHLFNQRSYFKNMYIRDYGCLGWPTVKIIADSFIFPHGSHHDYNNQLEPPYQYSYFTHSYCASAKDPHDIKVYMDKINDNLPRGARRKHSPDMATDSFQTFLNLMKDYSKDFAQKTDANIEKIAIQYHNTLNAEKTNA